MESIEQAIVSTMYCSTKHISLETIRYLDDVIDDIPCLVAFGDRGYCWNCEKLTISIMNMMPEEIQAIIEIARLSHCNFLIIDRNGPLISGLSIYE